MNTSPQTSPDQPSSVAADNVAPRISRAPLSTPKREAAATTNTDVALKKLRLAKGATIQQLAEATGWQLHSVRGFLSATVRKKLCLNLVSDVGKDEVRRYRILDISVGAS